MKATIIKIFWGVILISLGVVSLADRLGTINLNSVDAQIWTIIFAGLSLAFFLSYFVSGVRQWGWLFPALIFAALALVISEILDNSADLIIPAVIMLSVALPFYIGFVVNRKHWGLLIPAWVLTIVAFIPALDESANSNIIATLILIGIAVPFLAVFLLNQSRKWALTVATALGVIGLMPLTEFLPNGDLAGPIVMFLFFLVFFVTFFMSKKNWWALIPAGLFGSIGLVALLNAFIPYATYIHVGQFTFGIYTGVLFLGIAITFGVLWLLRASRPTAWSIYPAIGFLVLAVVTSLFSQKYADFLPSVVLLVVGAAIIVASVYNQRKSKPAII